MKMPIICGFLTLCANLASAQNELRGKILDSLDQPIPGVIIKVSESFLISSSTGDGSFKMQFPKSGNYEIIVSSVGFITDTIKLEIPYLTELKCKLMPAIHDLPIAMIEALRVTNKIPIAQSSKSAEEIEKLNNGQDLPFLIRFSPSVTVTSDAGTGIGYTGIRIRGSDASRINVTINGIPLNDPESQAVYWVNIPDFASSISSLQIQRGLGSSTNGAGAFGASINIATEKIRQKAFGEIANSIGSFNTFKHTVQFGTGLISDRWSIDGRLSQISSDGYIDRATADLKSYYIAGNFIGEKTSIKAIVFGGAERTYQSWFGTPQSRVENDIQGMLTHASNNGFSDAQVQNLLGSGRTYNFYLYENEVDNYNQDHYQLHLRQQLNGRLYFNLSAHYTWGRGYFEQFRENDDLHNYGISPIDIANELVYSNSFDDEGNPINTQWPSQFNNPDISVNQAIQYDSEGNPITDPIGNTLLNLSAEINQSDIIRRRWLNNDFYGLTWALNYETPTLKAIWGGAANEYDGDHYGEIIWAEYTSDTNYEEIFYLNNGLKRDINSFFKIDWDINEKLLLFVDLQMRDIDYKINGMDIDFRNLQLDQHYTFFNPKAGLSYQLFDHNLIYASYGISSREPMRSDFIDVAADTKPIPEEMQDLEIGIRRNTNKYYVNLNFYNMQYDNQLVLTGELNDVGNSVRSNVKDSYRRGLEAEFGMKILKKWELYLTSTISQNKIKLFEEVVYDYGLAISETIVSHQDSDISFSPELTASGMLSYKAIARKSFGLELAWMYSYVSDQYLDNTSNSERMLDAYLVNDLRITCDIKTSGKLNVSVNLLLNNILNSQYSSNGYTYTYIYGQQITENFYYPQAGRNAMLGLTLKF